MKVPPTSPMHAPATVNLRVRALGEQGATLWLVANGIFCGLGDTASPLRWVLAFAALNAALDPLFVFALGLCCPGTAACTVVVQYAALAPLLWQVGHRLHALALIIDGSEPMQNDQAYFFSDIF
jgi:Na+-driven multidrug efflux pump